MHYQNEIADLWGAIESSMSEIDLLFSPLLHVVHEHVYPGECLGLRRLLEEHPQWRNADVGRRQVAGQVTAISGHRRPLRC